MVYLGLSQFPHCPSIIISVPFILKKVLVWMISFMATYNHPSCLALR